MTVDRRSILKGMVVTGATAITAPATAAGAEVLAPPPDTVGMLYDATRCIGCKSCVLACREANDLPFEEDTTLWDAPSDLSARTKNVIKLYREENAVSYMKAQCMHCVDPACVSVCMIGALHKAEGGVVAYDPARCIGCRYCQIACPFNVPKFEWDTPTPLIVKCELCRHRLAQGQLPACCEVCPTGAVIFGKRSELLIEARQRIADSPSRYYPKIYGEHDGGGTQVLYLSAVPFEKLGLPDLGDKPVPSLSRTLQHGIYKGFIAPAALFTILGAVLLRNRRNNHDGDKDEAEETVS